MKTPKTISIIECRRCGGSYYGGETKVVLNPGTEDELPDELYILVRKIGRCIGCKEGAPRTRAGRRTKFER
jgi:hypothetical protein